MVAMMHLLHHVLRTPGGKKKRKSCRENSNLTCGYARYKGRDDKFFNLDFGKGNDDDYLKLHLHPCRNPKGQCVVDLYKPITL